MHTTPVLLITILLPGIVSCAIKVVKTKDQKAVARNVPAANTLSHPIACQSVAVDHWNQFFVLENFAQFSILYGVHPHIVDILEEPRVNMVLGTPT